MRRFTSISKFVPKRTLKLIPQLVFGRVTFLTGLFKKPRRVSVRSSLIKASEVLKFAQSSSSYHREEATCVYNQNYDACKVNRAYRHNRSTTGAMEDDVGGHL